MDFDLKMRQAATRERAASMVRRMVEVERAAEALRAAVSEMSIDVPPGHPAQQLVSFMQKALNAEVADTFGGSAPLWELRGVINILVAGQVVPSADLQ